MLDERELVGEIRTELLQELQRAPRLVLIDLAQREADVDQHPVPDLEAVGHEQADVDRPPDAGDLRLREMMRGVEKLDDLARNP